MQTQKTNSREGKPGRVTPAALFAKGFTFRVDNTNEYKIPGFSYSALTQRLGCTETRMLSQPLHSAT